MYTRSYPRQDDKKSPPPPTEALNASPPHKILTEKEIPEGYSGTTVLRENESVSKIDGSAAQGSASSAYVPPYRANTRAKKFKVATKASPSLWRSSDGNSYTAERESSECETSDILSKNSSELNPAHQYTAHAVSDIEKDVGFAENCSNGKKSICESRCEDSDFEENGCGENGHGQIDTESNRCEKEKRGARPYKRKLWRPSAEKHCFKRTRDTCLRERSFSLEDLLLGGLILLMLNEGADDDVILIFAFLLFSSL